MDQGFKKGHKGKKAAIASFGRTLMQPEEVRAEIERRRKHAQDLRLREILWSLYDSHLKVYPEKLRRDPELVYPPIRRTLEFRGTSTRFELKENVYNLSYREAPSETERYGSGRNRQETTTTPATIALELNDATVFEFQMTHSVTYTPDMPLFNKVMGTVNGFIKGPWTTHIAELLECMKSHEKAIWERRRAPQLQQKLHEDMKRFGL